MGWWMDKRRERGIISWTNKREIPTGKKRDRMSWNIARWKEIERYSFWCKKNSKSMCIGNSTVFMKNAYYGKVMHEFQTFCVKIHISYNSFFSAIFLRMFQYILTSPIPYFPSLMFSPPLTWTARPGLLFLPQWPLTALFTPVCPAAEYRCPSQVAYFVYILLQLLSIRARPWVQRTHPWSPEAKVR